MSSALREGAKPELRLAFSDFWPGFVPERSFLVRVLGERFDVRVDPEAKILVFAPFGAGHVTHRGTKVLLTGEPWPLPDGAYDFCISWRPPQETCLRLPGFQWDLIEHPELPEALERRPTLAAWAARAHFCSFVYSNTAAAPERAAFFGLLNERRFVHAPGAQCNNSPPLPGGRHASDFRRMKLDYERGFRFSVAFENSSHPGYTTEKLPDALAAGTIPIYWGNTSVAEDFQAGAFVNAHDFDSLADLADFVVVLDDDRELATPYLAASARPLVGRDDVGRSVCDFFSTVAAHKPSRRASVVRPLMLTVRDGVPAAVRRTRRAVGARARHLYSRELS